MNAAKQCKERFEDIVALVMGELDSTAARELQEHLALCDTCRAARDALVEEEKEVRLGFAALAGSLGPVEQTVLEKLQHPARVRVDTSNNHFFEKVKTMILSHKRLSATAATLTALAASLLLYAALFSSSTPAYALEQTAQANDRVTSYHVKITPPQAIEGIGKAFTAGLGEAWVELGPEGAPLHVRLNMFGGVRGDRVVVMSKNRAELWLKTKKFCAILNAKGMIDAGLDECMKVRALFDPKLAFEQLQADEKAGKVQVATKEPVKQGEPIRLTATSNDKPDRRQVYEVDPKTKLVQRVIEYKGHGDQWKQVSERDYSDYSKEIYPSVFQLELPNDEDITMIDQTKTDRSKLGLAQGNLTDDQIATKVAKEFIEALIARDFEKVSQLDELSPATAFKKRLEHEKIKFLRIVELGEPAPFEYSSHFPKRKRVPVKVEMEIEGKKTVEEMRFIVGPVDKNSDRWGISGGF
jgi:hypothetical protein